jgi:hypothetical protein
MPKEVITSLIGAFTALIPLIINYAGKKSKDSMRKNLLDESQERITFINNYYDAMHRLLPESEMETLKTRLAAELQDMKNKISEADETHFNTNSKAHFTFQKIFLTYRPVSFMGWIWAILFYLNLSMLIIVFLTLGVDDQGVFSWNRYLQDITDSGTIIILIILIATLLLFHWFAILSYKRNAAAARHAA